MATTHPDVGHDFRRLLHLVESGFLGTFLVAGSPRRSRARLPPSRTRGSRPGAGHGWRSCAAATRRSSGSATPPTIRHQRSTRWLVIRGRRWSRSPAGGPYERAPGRIVTGAEIRDLSSVEVDFVVVGSGAGGSTAAAVLAAAGAHVVVLEEGGHYTRRDFNMQESWAYPALYQEHGNRATDDLAIMILQGRTVGGGTTVNWTSSFRTPEQTSGALGGAARRARHRRGDAGAALRGGGAAPRRRHRRPRRRQQQQPQAAGGGRQAGVETRADPPQRQRVRPARLLPPGLPARRQAHLAHDLPGRRDRRRRRRLRRLPRQAARDRSAAGRAPLSPRCSIGRATARAAASSPTRAAGSSWPGGPSTRRPCSCARRPAPTAGRSGRRTFLHPTVPIVAFYDQPIEAFYGAPQSVSVHHFADRGERVGYFLETAPVHPMLAALALPGFGDTHRKMSRGSPTRSRPSGS